MLQSQMINYIQILNFVEIAYKIFINWSNIPYSSTQCQFFVAYSHQMSCNLAHYYWNTLNTHAPIILGYIPLGGVINLRNA